MSIFTIGHAGDYDAAIANGLANNRPIKKIGAHIRDDGTQYYGGYAFETARDAFAYIDKLGKRGEWGVYEIDAVWPDHVWHGHPSDDFMRLNRDAMIIGKVEPSSPVEGSTADQSVA